MYDWSQERCDDPDIPDLPARAIRDAGGRIVLFQSHYDNRRFVGPTFDRLKHVCRRVMRSDRREDPAAFADREWIAAPYTRDGRNVFALVHNEYQGYRHPGRCASLRYLNCWYNAITLAVSRDGGASFRQARPPRHLVAAIPQHYRADAGRAGMFSPSNIVRSPKDGYYYALVRVMGYGGSPRGTCVLRTRRVDEPRAWRGWNGEGFDLRFTDPYRSPPEKGRFCAPVAWKEIVEMVESLTFNTRLDRFLLVGMAGAFDQARREVVWGIYYSVSEDLVTWTPRRLLLEAPTKTQYRCGGPNPIGYPSLIDPRSRSRSFETTGARAYVYFTRFNYRRCEQTLDRDLVRVPVAISK